MSETIRDKITIVDRQSAVDGGLEHHSHLRCLTLPWTQRGRRLKRTRKRKPRKPKRQNQLVQARPTKRQLFLKKAKIGENDQNAREENAFLCRYASGFATAS